MIGVANSHILSLYFVTLMILISELFRLVNKKITKIEVVAFIKATGLTILGSIYMICQFCDFIIQK